MLRLPLRPGGDLESVKLRCLRRGGGENERDKLRSLPLVFENLGRDLDRDRKEPSRRRLMMLFFRGGVDEIDRGLRRSGGGEAEYETDLLRARRCGGGLGDRDEL